MTSLRDSVDTLTSSVEALTDTVDKLSSRVSLIESGIHCIILKYHSQLQSALANPKHPNPNSET